MSVELTYQQTVELCREHHLEIVELVQDDARVAVCPTLAGRIVAASVAGQKGRNPFFLNPVDIKGGPEADKLIFRGAMGGRDWLGPEGCGDYSFYFRRKPLVFENWYVDDRHNKPVLQTTHTDTVSTTAQGEIHVQNLKGNAFDIGLDHKTALVGLDRVGLAGNLPAGINSCVFEHTASFTNIGSAAWDEAYGMCMIWFLLMLHGSDRFFIVVPYSTGTDTALQDYRFDDADIPSDRLIDRPKKRYTLFKGDGHFRSKVGMVPERSEGIAMGLDLDREMLTVLKFDVNRNTPYLNNLWTEEAIPTGGNVMDAYNNFGANEVLPGRFCEIEAVSPRLELAPQESGSLTTHTGFFQGPIEQLRTIMTQVSGRDFAEESFSA